jgi:glucose/arabinose dehydrogenase
MPSRSLAARSPWLAVALTGLLLAACGQDRPTATTAGSAGPTLTPPPVIDDLRVTVIQRGLEAPWDIAFAPDGSMFVSERRIGLKVYASGDEGAELLASAEVPDLRTFGEAGVMGVAIDADFESFPYLYVCASRDADGEEGPAPWRNELLRYRVTPERQLEFEGSVFDEMIIANRQHDGCAVQADTDGTIWMSTGDALGNQELRSQLTDGFNGKVLHLNRDGTPAEGNPTLPGNDGPTLVFSYGHRNPQGVAIHPETGEVYNVEHGPRVNDEINHPRSGGNYGWPCYSGADTPNRPPLPPECGSPGDYLPPAWASGERTIATSGAVFLSHDLWGDWRGSLIVTTLKEKDLRRFSLAADGETFQMEQTLVDDAYGRLRAAVIGRDGALYVTTSNIPNAGRPDASPPPPQANDVILRIAPTD